jgi:hypothetical protein
LANAHHQRDQKDGEKQQKENLSQFYNTLGKAQAAKTKPGSRQRRC